jgi:AraC-like DNA-binding protein
MQRVMHRCVDETRRAGTGQHFPIVLGESFAFEYLSDVETFITTSASMRDAARALEWIPPLINPYLTFSVAEHGQEARIALQFQVPDHAGADTSWPFTEGVIATTIKFSRMLLGSEAPIGRITLRHGRHANAAQVEAHFNAPIEWGAPLDAIWFDRALLDVPLRGAFPVLHEQAAQRLEKKIAQRTESAPADAPGQSRALIRQIERAFRDKPRLMGLGLEALAEEIGIHARTLQRRLKDLGDSHSAIQSRIRYELAQQWLKNETLPIEDISDRLGFSDRRSFTQAFSRWSGVTPSQYRRQQG